MLKYVAKKTLWAFFCVNAISFLIFALIHAAKVIPNPILM